MSIMTRLCYVIPGALAGVLANHGYVIYDESKKIPQPQRGSLIVRMAEVAMAWVTLNKISDAYTASRHCNTMCHISAKKVSKGPDSLVCINERANAVETGYLQKIFQKHPVLVSPVFKVYNSQRVIDEKFYFAGPLENIHDLEARDDLTKGDYVRCKSAAITEIPANLQKQAANESQVRQLGLTDVLLTGNTTNCNICEEFQKAHLHEAAKLAAMNQLKPTELMAKTDVLRQESNAFHKVSTLANLPENLKDDVLKDKFVSCHFRNLDQSVAREAKYTDLSAYVIGTADPEVCQKVLYGYKQQNL